MYVATVVKELYEGKALLLYICGDGLPKFTPPSNSDNSTNISDNVTGESSTTQPFYGLAMHAGRPERYNRTMSITSPRAMEAAAGVGGNNNNSNNNNNNNSTNNINNMSLPSHQSDAIYPEDIRPFTRRPLFIIIDSDASSCFKVWCLISHNEY